MCDICLILPITILYIFNTTHHHQLVISLVVVIIVGAVELLEHVPLGLESSDPLSGAGSGDRGGNR